LPARPSCKIPTWRPNPNGDWQEIESIAGRAEHVTRRHREANWTASLLFENGHTVPAIETLQKLAKAMNVPFHMLFFDGPGEPKPLKLKGSHQKATAKDDARFAEFAKRMAKMNKRDRNLFVMMAAKMAKATEN
jgi:hypothetical protein